MDIRAEMEAKWGISKRISALKYIKRNPKMLDEFATREVRMFGLSWTEYLARSSQAEVDFARSLRDAQGGLFGEVMNIIYVMDGGKLMKKAAYSGEAREISSVGIHSFRPFETHPEKSRIGENQCCWNFRQVFQLTISCHFPLHASTNFRNSGDGSSRLDLNSGCACVATKYLCFGSSMNSMSLVPSSLVW